jgi:hypothetical protein
MDIDPEVLRLADEFTRDCGVPRRRFVRGNALERTAYPACGFHAVVSTGLGEFLETFELEQFYRNVHAVLRPGGTFYTSATALDRRSEAFLRAFELLTHYRTSGEIRHILEQLPWRKLTITRDAFGLQTFVTAVK